ncbi:MAG: hypothetical protein WDO72_11980 [Pseudomonadota bacterium]
MNPIQPISPERPNASAKPGTAVDAVSNQENEAPEQDADVSSDRAAPGSAGAKSSLEINEIEDLESDVEGG